MTAAFTEKLARPLVFWQPTLSIHQTPLLERLAQDWDGPIYLIIDLEQLEGRTKESGWKVEAPQGVAVSTSGGAAPVDAIHVVSGFHGTQQWRQHRRAVLQKKDADIWVMSESLPTWDNKLKVFLRFLRQGTARIILGRRLAGFLAIGNRAKIQARKFAVPSSKIFPFCYVTAPQKVKRNEEISEGRSSLTLFIGRVNKGKASDALFAADLGSGTRLRIIGHHSDKSITIPPNVEYLGVIPHHEVYEQIRQADVLVLPSRHDGWGAVVNEALMMGTPVVCSEACGSAALLRTPAPYRGEVISDSTPQLIGAAVRKVLSAETDRDEILKWSARSITPDVVSPYLISAFLGKRRPAPWETE